MLVPDQDQERPALAALDDLVARDVGQRLSRLATCLLVSFKLNTHVVDAGPPIVVYVEKV